MNGYDLIYNNNRYPPKYLVSITNKYANNEELKPSEFSGGHETNNFLRQLGFDVDKKPQFRNEKP